MMTCSCNKMDCEVSRGQSIIDRTLRFLEDSNRTNLADHLRTFYQAAVPYLEKARHGNPVHHTAHVAAFAVQIGIAENLTDDEMITLMAAAVFHDTGFANIAPNVKKIKLSDIRAIDDPVEKENKRKEAIKLRQLHAVEGAKIAQDCLSKLGCPANQISRIAAMVERHDDPSIAELEDDQDKKKDWLFTPEMKLEWILREADRLWMVCPDGVMADIESDRSKGKSTTVEEKLVYNTSRHCEERELYDKAYPNAKTLFGFGDEAFYIHPKARCLFQDLQEETLA